MTLSTGSLCEDGRTKQSSTAGHCEARRSAVIRLVIAKPVGLWQSSCNLAIQRHVGLTVFARREPLAASLAETWRDAVADAAIQLQSSNPEGCCSGVGQ